MSFEADLLKPGLIFAAPVLSQVTESFETLPIVSDPVRRPDSSSLLGKPIKSAAVSSRTDNSAGSLLHAKQGHYFYPFNLLWYALLTSSFDCCMLTNICMVTGDMTSAERPSANNCCSSTESTPRTWPSGEMIDQGNHGPPLRGNSKFIAHILLGKTWIERV